MLGLDAERLDQGDGASQQDNSQRFLGDDGIAVELGPSWASWAEAGSQ